MPVGGLGGLNLSLPLQPGPLGGRRSHADVRTRARTQSVLVAALLGFVRRSLGACLLRFAFLRRDLTLRVGLGLLGFAFAPELVLAGDRSDGLFRPAFNTLDDALRTRFGPTVLVAHRDSSSL